MRLATTTLSGGVACWVVFALSFVLYPVIGPVVIDVQNISVPAGFLLASILAILSVLVGIVAIRRNEHTIASTVGIALAALHLLFVLLIAVTRR